MRMLSLFPLCIRQESAHSQFVNMSRCSGTALARAAHTKRRAQV